MILSIANALFVLAAAIALPAQAGTQDIAGFYCQNGEFSFVQGPAFSATCTGDFYIDSSSVIHADESITLISGSNMTLWGTLVAPSISLTANRDLSVGGGFFSGVADALPEVNALSHAASGSAFLRTFSDLVPNPFIHPVYGAAMFTLQVGAPVISVESSVAGFEFATAEFEVFEFVIAEPVAGLVPEPGTYALFGVGGLMVIWAARRRAAKR